MYALDDDQLEEFVRQWSLSKKTYALVQRFDAPGDLGRDVVGFLTDKKHEGAWHNYQCKQYGKTISTEVGLRELGKILYNASQGNFSPPDKYYFVAPRGINRNLVRYISKPTELKKALIDNWDKYCAEGIVEGTVIPLEGKVLETVSNWDFSLVHSIGLDEILDDDAAKPVLFKWFGTDPGPPPEGTMPAEHTDAERTYISQLYAVYAAREKCNIDKLEDLESFLHHKRHLTLQRERFFDADAFSRFYRDNTDDKQTAAFTKDLYHGVIDTYNAVHDDALKRVDAVMIQAANSQPAGLLGKHARNPVKQGFCHHFANDGTWSWWEK